jgi:hypothetical protein
MGVAISFTTVPKNSAVVTGDADSERDDKTREEFHSSEQIYPVVGGVGNNFN